MGKQKRIQIFSSQIDQGKQKYIAYSRGVFLSHYQRTVWRQSSSAEESGSDRATEPERGCTTSPIHTRLLLPFAGLGGTKFELFCFMSLIRGQAPWGSRVALALLKAPAFTCHYYLWRGERKGESYFIPGSASPATVIISQLSCKLSTDFRTCGKKKSNEVNVSLTDLNNTNVSCWQGATQKPADTSPGPLIAFFYRNYIYMPLLMSWFPNP